MMQKTLRQKLVATLWADYRQRSPQINVIAAHLAKMGADELVLDHFAVIDLPSSFTGIPFLCQIFSALGYSVQGRDYLPEKQNDFLWLAEADSKNYPPDQVLPQVVVADFRLDEMPKYIRAIIHKYAQQNTSSPLHEIQKLAGRVFFDDAHAAEQLYLLVTRYFQGRSWSKPTVKEFLTVKEFNELLAWVLVFGRQPNHFTISAHLLSQFSNLEAFNHFIEQELNISLNHDGGVIKGGKEVGIAQSSTKGEPKTLQLADGEVSLPTDFVEFVWRYPQAGCTQPKLWHDYFTGFVAQSANRVIQSLYTDDALPLL